MRRPIILSALLLLVLAALVGVAARAGCSAADGRTAVVSPLVKPSDRPTPNRLEVAVQDHSGAQTPAVRQARQSIVEPGDVTRIIATFCDSAGTIDIEGTVRVVWSEAQLETDRSGGHARVEAVSGGTFACEVPAAAYEARLEFYPVDAPAHSVLVSRLRFSGGRIVAHGLIVVEARVEFPKAQSKGWSGALLVDGMAMCPRGARAHQESLDGELTTTTALLIHPSTGRFSLNGSADSLQGVLFESDETVPFWLDGREVQARWAPTGNTVSLERGARLVLDVRTEDGHPLPGLKLRHRFELLVEREFGRLALPFETQHQTDDIGEVLIEGLPTTQSIEILAGWGQPNQRLALYSGPREAGTTTREMLIVPGLDPYFTVWGVISSDLSAGNEVASTHVRCSSTVSSEASRSKVTEDGMWRATCLANREWTFELYAGDRSLSMPVTVEAEAGSEVGPLDFSPRERDRVLLSWSGVPKGSTLSCYRRLIDSRGRNTSVEIPIPDASLKAAGSTHLEVELETSSVLAVLTGANETWTHREEYLIDRSVDHISMTYEAVDHAADIDNQDRTWSLERGRIKIISTRANGHVEVEAPYAIGRVELPVRLPHGTSIYILQLPTLDLNAVGTIECDGQSVPANHWIGTIEIASDAAQARAPIILLDQIGSTSLSSMPLRWRRLDLMGAAAKHVGFPADLVWSGVAETDR